MKKAAPCLSVIIPAFNAADYIEKALVSITAQTRSDFEVIVVDDGSTDGTSDLVRGFIGAQNGPEIRLIEQPNTGASSARNLGIRTARSELVGFLDADDLWHPDKVAAHVQLMSRLPNIDLSFSGFCFVDGDGADLFERFCPTEGVVPFAVLIERNIIHTSTVVARRSAVLGAECFDTNMKTYEDYDLWIKIAALRPANIYGVSRCLADYRRHADQTTRDWRAMHEGWQQVVGRLKTIRPKDWGNVERKAWAYQLEYCAALAYNAGLIEEMRQLMRRAWQMDGWALVRRKDPLIMTGIAVISYLPRPMQIPFGWVFMRLRKLIRFVETIQIRTNQKTEN